MRSRHILIVTVSLTLLAAATARADKPPRFAALLANGTRLHGNVVTEWCTVASLPKLDGQPLTDAGNPLRWLRDRSLSPSALPKAFVEMTSGDRLPGVTLDYQTGDESRYEPAPAHFVVRPELRQTPPQAVAEPRVRVVARFVRRLVWQRREVDEYQPGTLYYRDGRSVMFRAARFGDGLVNLLLADGQRKILFTEIAELHLPTGDLWNAYFDELATLCPNGAGRLLQLETVDGLVATASLERFAANGTADYQQCVHGVQPAWSLELLWVPTAQVWMRRLFAAHEVPLSRLWPAASQQRSLLGGPGQPWRVNRNVQSGPLRSGGQDFGWGLGVHAFSELHFDLPPCATAFRTTVGLDRIAGKGGCARARVMADTATSPPLYESPLLIGSDNAFDSGDIPLAAGGPRKRLILQIDAAHDNRPPGTDPFDIRDMTDWLDPLLQLDPEKLKVELAARGSQQRAAWQGWTVRSDDSASAATPAAPANPAALAGLAENAAVVWTTLRDRWSLSPGRFQLGSLATSKPLVLERDFTLGPDDQWLALAVQHSIDVGTNARLEVRLGGEPLGEFTVPAENVGAGTPPPLLLSLREFRGQKVRLQIIQHPTPAAAPVFWRAIRVGPQLPTLFQAFDDEGDFEPLDAPAGGAALVTDEDRHSGTRSVKVSPAGQFHLRFQSPVAVREKPGLGEFRFLTFAFRKSGEGRFSLAFTSSDATDQALRLDGGRGEPSQGAARRVWQDKLPDQWIDMPRDLFADFGNVNVSGITLSAPDGNFARFDRIYLARAAADFELIPQLAPPPPNPSVVNDTLRPAVLRAAAFTVAIRFDDGRMSTGVISSADGDVLTAGHAVLQPNRPAEIFLPDGRVVAAQTRGVFRDRDWGLLKITDTGAWPAAELLQVPDLPRNLLYLSVAFSKSFAPGDAPAAMPASLRHVTPRLVRCDRSPDEHSAGGPLLDQYGRVAGLLTHGSRFGDAVYARFTDLAAALPRLKNGEVWGRWPVGAAPTLGIDVTSTATGCQITRLFADFPTARAGLLIGDTITKLAAQPIRDESEIHQGLTAFDPGQPVEITFQRGTATLTSTITLTPRVP